jgi:hypothetical protein
MVRSLVAKPFAAALLALALMMTPALAATQSEINATLRNDASIWDQLFVLALADQIREHCPTLEARTVRATRYVFGVYSQARDYGYSRAEIRAFQTDDGTEADMRARVLSYFAQHGVREGAPDTYCALGAAEMSAGTPAGTLLRAR